MSTDTGCTFLHSLGRDSFNHENSNKGKSKQVKLIALLFTRNNFPLEL